MANVLINDTYLKAIGEAIRSKLGTVLKYKPSEMATAINNIQTLKGGGYKVNITQSEHQTITVSQPSFNNRTAGFTIDDYPSINVSLKADPGYTAGSLNLTNFTFSNDVREVDIFATAATLNHQNITYNGNMNVFLAQVTGGNMFNITTGTKDDSRVPFREYTNNEAFALSLADNDDGSWERLSINYKDNFYNLDPNTNYKITAIKIGDTSLSDTDLSDNYGGLNISSTDTDVIINADISKTWVKSVYKQCTGKELNTKAEINLSVFSPVVLDYFLQSSINRYSIKYPGEQIANRISGEPTSELVDFLVLPYDSSEFFKTLSSDKKTEFANSVNFFMTSYKTNTTGFRDGNLIQNYFNVLKQFKDQYANDTTATTILEKYDPLKNNIFLDAAFGTSIDIFEIVYKIDSSNTYGLTSSLNGGLAYVLWVFYAYYLIIGLFLFSGFTPDEPIISTIPVSITFTNVTQ